MGMYGLKSLSGVFEGKIFGMPAPPVNVEPTPRGSGHGMPQMPSLGPMQRSINLAGKGKDIESKIFGSVRKNNILTTGKINNGVGVQRALAKQNMFFKPIVGNTEQLSWNRVRKQYGLSLFGDQDRDGTPNVFDCDPWDRKKQAVIHDMVKFKRVINTPGGKLEVYKSDYTPTDMPNGMGGAFRDQIPTSAGPLDVVDVQEYPDDMGAMPDQPMPMQPQGPSATDKVLSFLGRAGAGTLKGTAQAANALFGNPTPKNSPEYEEARIRGRQAGLEEINRRRILYEESRARQAALLQEAKRQGFRPGEAQQQITIDPYTGQPIMFMQQRKGKKTRNVAYPVYPGTIANPGLVPLSQPQNQSVFGQVAGQTREALIQGFGSYDQGSAKVRSGFAVTGGGPNTLVQASYIPQTQSYRDKVISAVGSQRDREALAQQSPMQGQSYPQTQQTVQGGVWSPYSRKPVTYTRGPYRKHTMQMQ